MVSDDQGYCGKAGSMKTMKIKIFCVWPCAIEGGVDKGTPVGKKCLDEKILKTLFGGTNPPNFY